MTAEMQKVAHDPNYALEFAIGAPAPDLPAQPRGSGITVAGVYYDEVKRYILKSAKFSREDLRIFEHESGQLVYVSHHPGKNPYEMLDPLGMANTDAYYNVAGGEWSSLCDITGYCGMPDLRIRPKTMSFHGRQNVKCGDEVVMNIGKMGKFKAMSLRPHFVVGKGDDRDMVYKCVADMVGRTVSIYNEDEQMIAQVAKTKKAMIKTVVLGSGSESTIDIAPGVDCSAILAIVFGLEQVGQHFMSDAFNNYVSDPIKDSVVDSAVDGVTDAIDGDDNENENEEPEEPAEPEEPEEPDTSADENEDTGTMADAGRFMFNQFFGGGDEGEDGGDDDGGGGGSGWGGFFDGGGDDDGGDDGGGDE